MKGWIERQRSPGPALMCRRRCTGDRDRKRNAERGREGREEDTERGERAEGREREGVVEGRKGEIIHGLLSDSGNHLQILTKLSP